MLTIRVILNYKKENKFNSTEFFTDIITALLLDALIIVGLTVVIQTIQSN